MDTWLRTTFSSELLTDATNPTIVLDVYPDGGRLTIPIATLATLLTGIGLSGPCTYAQLSATTLANAGGWQHIFDAWKAKGLIS